MGHTLRISALAAGFVLFPCAAPASPQAPPHSGEEVRTVAGLDQAAASGASPAFKFFLDFYISRPLPLYRSQTVEATGLGPRLRWWGNIRLASAPRQANIPIRGLSPELATQAASLKLNELAQSGEFLTGPEYRLTEFDTFLHNFNNHSDQAFSKVSLHLIAGFGAIGQTSPKDSIQFFKVPPESTPLYNRLVSRHPAVAGHQTVGFSLDDRDRFLRQFFVGFRLRTHYFDSAGAPLSRPPANLDITLGQNEANSGGRLAGAVFRLEAFYPLPISQNGVLYLFGMANLRPSRATSTDPLLLELQNEPIRHNSTVFVTIPQSSRDSYRIGFGVDLLRLISASVGGKR
ncbi:MAG: hypothetical protein FJW20_08215 [Acidimicrobiia bacterium]|nr:hypothetical protein [Acidimicrobiia bacterium]